MVVNNSCTINSVLPWKELVLKEFFYSPSKVQKAETRILYELTAWKTSLSNKELESFNHHLVIHVYYRVSYCWLCMLQTGNCLMCSKCLF